jgi:flagellar motor component MotA
MWLPTVILKDNYMDFSEWFKKQSINKQSTLVNVLFSLRQEAKKNGQITLFDEMLGIIDNEYHRNKGE